jgi:aromatic-L-amino-acid decarboxylase
MTAMPSSDTPFTITPVTVGELDELLPLVRAYCDFYEVEPSDRDLRTLMLTLLAAGGRDGLQLLARDDTGAPVAFATLLFTWSTTSAARAAVLNDLYVAPEVRGHGLAEALIERCTNESARRGAAKLTWITRPDNQRAQAVYDRTVARRDPWVTYRVDLPHGRSLMPKPAGEAAGADERDQRPAAGGVENVDLHAPGPFDTALAQLPELLDATAADVVEHLARVPERPVAPAAPTDPQAVRGWLRSTYDFEQPRAAAAVVADLLERLKQWTVHTTHPRYFGLFNPTPTAAGIAGELLAAGINPQLAAWSHAPAAAEAEQHVLGFIAARLGLPAAALAGNVTTGGAEANLTAVLLALTHAFPAYATNGLRSLEIQPVFYASAESHLAWVKIAHATGLGRDALRLVAVDEQLRLDVDELARLMAADRAAGHRPFLIVGTAGTTGAGALDPLGPLADLAAEHGAWFHADAAWAGAIALSDRLRPLLAGVERSDSVTVDAHKWLSVPMGAGMILTRHPDTLAQTFRLTTAFMPTAVEDAADPYTTSLQWSRRFAGLKIFLALAVAGRAGYAAQIERDAELGRHLARRLADDGWELVNDTPLPVVCFSHPHTRALDPQASFDWHARVAERVLASGHAWISAARLAERPALRACITSYRTTAHDVDQLVTALAHARHRVPS